MDLIGRAPCAPLLLGGFVVGGHRLLPTGASERTGVCILAAALALLQPGIDPVFLTLLAAATSLDPSNHGWIVGATQAGMAMGGIIIWRGGTSMPRMAPAFAALIAFVTSVMTPALDDLWMLIAVRGLFGIGMGVAYTYAMSMAAASRPALAYGAVFIIQLLLSTLVALVLPAISDAARPVVALRLLAVFPAGLLLLLSALPASPVPKRATVTDRTENVAPPLRAWALATALFCFIAATMMVWSFAGALAMAAGINDDVIGTAVAIGSVVGALTALTVMRDHMVVPLPLTGLLSSLCLLAPLVMTRPGSPALFILSIGLLNVGSTATIVRFSGEATAAHGTLLFRRFVSCIHGLGMIAGPVAGSILSTAFGPWSLIDGVTATLLCGCVALLVATRAPAPGLPQVDNMDEPPPDLLQAEKFCVSRPDPLDQSLTLVQP